MEVARIKAVKEIIAEELVDRIKKSDELQSYMRSINKEMWDESGGLGYDVLELTTYMQYISLLKQNVSDISENKKRILMLERQYKSPYFCRIDFKEDGYETESFYIGIYGFRKANTIETLIYDWRAPISSLFYDYELGPASYKCPSGNIEGELLLKRQFRIENGELKLMFDSNIAIEDDILQDILAQNTDSRMKTIVSTIQKEQNSAIRYDGKKVLVVSGPAGSGKTSIALHRAAYLLYRHRNNLKAENIVLFAPNEAFTDYISNVLPELGEENIKYHTFTTLVMRILGNKFIKYESYDEYMEAILLGKSSAQKDKRLNIIRFKASKEFVNIIEKYVYELEHAYYVFRDISVSDQLFADKNELEKLYHVDFSDMPIAKRLAQINFMIKSRINDYEPHRQKQIEKSLEINSDYGSSERKAISRIKVTRELESCRKDIDEICSLDIVSLYKNLFSDYMVKNMDSDSMPSDIVKFTLEALDDGLLLYEDQAPMLYMMSLLGMIEPDKKTKHVIIDEAQDYSEAMYKFLFHMYSGSNMAILGDPRQNINSYGSIGDLRELNNILNNDLDFLSLSKSYRSTQEISEFASHIIKSDYEFFGRHGMEPTIISSNTLDELAKSVTDYLNNIQSDDFNRIAVICRSAKDCRQIYDKIKDDLDAELITESNEQIPSGIIIIPSYLTKGLEFDLVAVVISSIDDYTFDEDTLLYTVCTRALHRLDIFAIKGAKILDKLSGDN